MLEALEACPPAVSYTHLDVYKRQTHTCVDDFIIVTDELRRRGIKVIAHLIPVSYTHLNPHG